MFEGLFIKHVLIPVVRFLVWPITTCAEHHMARRKRKDNRPPHSMPSQKRRRALTLLLPPKAKSRWTRSRSQSLLLNNLPLELRQIIWKESIGYMVFYVTIRNRKVVLSGIGPRDPHRPGPGFENWYLLAILLTCRQVYLEAINLLYSSNQFVVTDNDIIKFMPRILLPQRINAIQSLYFDWRIRGSPPYHRDDSSLNEGIDLKIRNWTTIWKNLADMEGLRELYVDLYVDRYFWDTIQTADASLLVKPIMAVTAPRYFELRLPFTCQLGKELWEELPCQVKWIPPGGRRA